jgi:hypothetical protein
MDGTGRDFSMQYIISGKEKEKPCETHTNIVDKDRYTQ